MPKIRRYDPFQATRKALKDFRKNAYVAARLISGSLDHVLPPDMKAALQKDRERDPELVKAANECIERAVKAGKHDPDKGKVENDY